MTQADRQSAAKPAASASLKSIIKIIIWVLVFAGVLWTGWKGYQDLVMQPNIRWQDFHWRWFALAVGAYFVGMAPSWLYWHWILKRFGFQSTLRDSFRAFFMSQLGKYVPGKVMVILIRTAILCHRPLSAASTDDISRHDRNWVIVTATALMETLTFISVGGLMGALAGTYFFADRWWVLALAISIAVLLPVPILPPVFRFWIRRLPLLKDPEAKNLVCECWNWRTFIVGFAVLPLGWLVLGSCLWFLFGTLPDSTLRLADYPAALTCVSLANVLGFVSLIPGGFGVREVVMYPILESRFTLAIVLVILYRLTSLTAEVIAGAVAWCLPPFKTTDSQ